MTEISLELVEKLAAAITELGLVITADQQQQLLQYLSLLYKWNKAYNLSGLQKLDEMLVLHVIDSLAVLPFFTANTIADIGTGAGLPGMVLAICKPEAELFLIDSNSKKTRFLFQAATALGLRNVHAVHARAEGYAIPAQVAIVTSRAFASLRNFIESSQHLLADNGRLLAMKGQYPGAEIADLPPGFTLLAIHPLHVPYTTVSRHLLDIRRSGNQDMTQ